MKLTALQIMNYHSIDDSGIFRIDDVTCLVGKNESGKTSILRALEQLKPYGHNAGAYDRIQDYPRSRSAEYEQLHDGTEAEVIKTTWLPSPEDVEAVEAFLGPGSLVSNEIVITKSYGPGPANWKIGIDEKIVIDFLARKSAIDASDLVALSSYSSTSSLHKAIADKGVQANSGETKLLAEIQNLRDQRATLKAIDILSPRIPHFLYFGNYDQMSGNVALSVLQQEVANKSVTPEHKVFLSFLAFAGIPLEEIAKLTNFESLIARLEAASNAISSQVFDYWTQNPYLRVTLSNVQGMAGDPVPFNSGWILRTRVYNELHKVTVDFDARSTGFVWFFSFLALFSQVRKERGNVIILLDEPGLSLHGRAQADLLRYFREKLKPAHQVIYTTHSPFMVPPDDLTTVRIVEDVVKLDSRSRPVSSGTKASEDSLRVDPDTLFPLQGALGYEITQSLFVGKNTLLLEGPGDVLMLQAASVRLQQLGREGLSSKWTMCPVGGLGKIAPFVSLFGGANRLNIAALADFAVGEKSELERLRRNRVLQEGRLLTADTYCGQDEADIEDFFGAGLYAKMVNNAFALPENEELTEELINTVDVRTPRIVKRVALLFGVMSPEVPEFDHFKAAYWLQLNPAFWIENSEEAEPALNRFEAFFLDVNVFTS